MSEPLLNAGIYHLLLSADKAHQLSSLSLDLSLLGFRITSMIRLKIVAIIVGKRTRWLAILMAIFMEIFMAIYSFVNEYDFRIIIRLIILLASLIPLNGQD